MGSLVIPTIKLPCCEANKVPCDEPRRQGFQDFPYNTLILVLLFSVDHETEAHRGEGALLGLDQLKREQMKLAV